MASSYCVVADLYNLGGLPRGAVPNPGRYIGAADIAAEAFTLGVHGFSTGDTISFRAEPGGSLPSPLVANVSYYAIAVTDDVFSVAASPGGAAIVLTTTGDSVLVIAPLAFAGAIAWASRIIDESALGNLVPFALPVPEIVKLTCAELAAGRLLLGAETASLSSMVDAAQKRLGTWAAGKPIRGENAPKPANVAASGAATLPYNDSRGWGLYGGIGTPPGWNGGRGCL